MKRIIAITGGIGSGKSVVAKIVAALGYPTYDCDNQAKILMDSDAAMKRRIADEVTPQALNADMSLNRRAISEIVFSDSKKLLILNSIVHGAVRTDICQWLKQTSASTMFIETAILYESGLDSFVNEIWEVTAPQEIRIERIARRNGWTRNEILQRIGSQSCQQNPSHHIIINNDKTAILPRILELISK